MRIATLGCVAVCLALLLPGIGGGWFDRTVGGDAFAQSSRSHSLSGQVELFSQGKKRKLSPRELETAVVSFKPDGLASVRPSRQPAKMTTRGKAFAPSVLAVTKGTTVAFPNEDPILHNVFSVTPGNRFDLGFYQKGPGKEYTFQSPGLVRVFCNVHYAMVGHVLVLETPYFTSPDTGGRFELGGLPAGTGTLTVWHERTDPVERRITVPSTGSLKVTLEVSKSRLVPHNNKLGQPYQRRGSGNRYD